jgi:hypothetical protein
MALELGTFGAWLNPVYDDSTRVKFVVEAEALGYTTAWLGEKPRCRLSNPLIQGSTFSRTRWPTAVFEAGTV